MSFPDTTLPWQEEGPVTFDTQLKLYIHFRMKLDVIVRNQPIFPFQVSVNWAGSEGEQIKKFEHELVVANNKILMYSPDRCTGKQNKYGSPLTEGEWQRKY